MRLIDADALCETIEKGIHENPHDDPKVRACHAHEHIHFLVEIARQPTVDAELVRHGRWKTVPYRIVEHGNVVISGEAEMCTNCRCAKKEYHKQMNYCPNCGAKMQEVK